MSCYIVDDETIFKIAWGLSDRRKIPPGYTNDAEGRVALANALKAMNAAAYEQRYGEVPMEQEGDAQGYQEVPRPCLQTSVQFLKTLEAYLYQCAEGEVRGWPLYVYLNQVVMRSVMMDIISTLPEYEKAPWG
jgi:hypothetical protein